MDVIVDLNTSVTGKTVSMMTKITPFSTKSRNLQVYSSNFFTMSTSFLLKCLVKNYVFYLSIIIRDKNIIKVKYWFCGSPGVLGKGLR